MEGGWRSELEPGHHGLDPASAVHFLQLWQRFSASSVKSDAGIPPPSPPRTGVCSHQSERAQFMLRFPPTFGDLAFP